MPGREPTILNSMMAPFWEQQLLPKFILNLIPCQNRFRRGLDENQAGS
jgi:hypothetical protein